MSIIDQYRPRTEKRGVGPVAVVLLVAAGALVGGSVGWGVASETATPAATAGPAAKTVTKTVTDEVVPNACIDALDAAEKVITSSMTVVSITGDLMANEIPDALTAAATFDAAGLNASSEGILAANDQINDESAKMADIDYASPASACRAAAGE